MKARAFSFHKWLATSERKKIIPNESQKPIWIPNESQVGNPNGPWVTSLGIIPVTSPQPRGIIIPIVSENLPFQGEKEGIDNAFGSELQG